MNKRMIFLKIKIDFKKNKLEIDAKRNWDIFYKRNTTNFFKDRQWTTREFEELCDIEDENVGDIQPRKIYISCKTLFVYL